MGNRERHLQAADRQRQALELRKAGVSYRNIAKQLGFAGPQGAFKAVGAALKDAVREPATEVKKLEQARLDGLLQAHWPLAISGSDKAAARVLGIMERRAKLLGLDEPRKIEATGADGGPLFAATTEDLAARFDELVRQQAKRLKHFEEREAERKKAG